MEGMILIEINEENIEHLNGIEAVEKLADTEFPAKLVFCRREFLGTRKRVPEPQEIPIDIHRNMTTVKTTQTKKRHHLLT
eukprot:UN28474